MRPSRGIAIVSLVAAMACDSGGSKSKDTPRQAAAPEGEAKAESPPKPKIDPHQTVEAGKAAAPMMVKQAGELELTAADQHYHMRDLPFGENKATWFEGKKGVIGILGLADEGFPKVKVTAMGWRLDELELPITLSAEDDAALVRFQFWVGEKGVFVSDDEATKRGENKLTLTKYEGKRLEGTFEATVAPKVETAGKPITLKGEFSTTLRLSGVGPDLVAKAKAEGDAPADGEAGKATK